MTGHALDALLAEYTAPPVPAGLAARVAAAALALPQEPRVRDARRATAPRHDRRGRWLRRPLLLGGVALGLAVSGAVAATLAGIRIDWPAVEAVLGDLPFVGGEASSESSAPARNAPPPAPALPAIEPALVPESRIETRAEGAPTAESAPAARDDPPPPVEPVPTPPPAAAAGPPLIETRPQALPGAQARELARPEPDPAVPAEREATTSVEEIRAPAVDADEASRLRHQQIERSERVRAARQAQIERLQRVQQRRERLRRLRRD